MTYPTRSRNPPTDPPAQASAAKRGPGRKRKADEPASATPASDQGSSTTTTSGAKPAPKKKKTSAGPPTSSRDTAIVVNPPSQDPPAPPSLIVSQGPTTIAIDEISTVPSPPTTAAPAPEESTEAQPGYQGSSTPDPTPGDNTRNRNQRAPGLREENAELIKANAELEAKLKQMTTDMRTLKKFKVLWLKDHEKKSQTNIPGQSGSLIPRPPGEKGKNGWNLQDAIGLKDDNSLYSDILQSTRHCISRSGLDWEATYSEQEPARLAACFKELKKLRPYLERFQGDWPAKEFVISALQNRRKVLNAKAKANLASDENAQEELDAAAAAVESANAE
ncbi:hypothetical protein FRC01_002577 [Tulasnella sp. 417]|nr:hypothetical protein FRC01_002577 [Tulasnella sp. 417]